MKRLLFILPLLLILTLVAVFFLHLEKPFAPTHSPMVGKSVPSNVLPGEVYVLNIFATWCVPCLAENPLLINLREEYKVRIHGILYKDDLEKAKTWLKKNGNPFLSVGLDSDGHTALNLGVRGVPETFVIDQEGIIRYHHAGPLDARTVQEIILPLVRSLEK